MSIFLSRHGETEYMLSHTIGGDSSLTAKGTAYARQLPQLVVPHLPQDAHGELLPVSVFTSKLLRTIQTAQHLPFQQQRLEALNEINAGICEHMTYEQVAQKYPEVHAARKQDKLGYRYPQGESYLDLIARLTPVVGRLQQAEGPVIVVAHQAVLRVLLGLLLDTPRQDIPTISIPLHTVMQLTPTADGRYSVTTIPADLTTRAAAGARDSAATAACSSRCPSAQPKLAPSISVKAWASCGTDVRLGLQAAQLPSASGSGASLVAAAGSS